MKYAVLNIDTECGGEAFFTTIDSEKELKEVIGSYTTYKKSKDGLELFNDGCEDDTEKDEIEDVTRQYEWDSNNFGKGFTEIFIGNEIDMDNSFVKLG